VFHDSSSTTAVFDSIPVQKWMRFKQKDPKKQVHVGESLKTWRAFPSAWPSLSFVSFLSPCAPPGVSFFEARAVQKVQVAMTSPFRACWFTTKVTPTFTEKLINSTCYS